MTTEPLTGPESGGAKIWVGGNIACTTGKTDTTTAGVYVRSMCLICVTSRCNVPGGMCHWLFRKMVIQDIKTSIEEAME